MAYRGEVFVMDLNAGGYNYDKNVDRIPATAMVGESINVNTHQGGRAKRGGTDNVNSTVIGGTPRVWGVYQYRQKDGTVEILTAGADGEILTDYDDSTPLKTGLTIDQPVHFETFNNLCYICTGNDQVQVYDGTTWSALAAPDVAWTGSNFPRKMITHGRGASERLWAIGCTTSPYDVYYSGLSAGDNSTEADFTSGNGILYVDTADGFGVLNAVEFGDRLICFGKNLPYIIDDTDSDAANWGYEKGIWEGGTATDRLLIPVGNDIVSMKEDGSVYSVITTESYGDYKKTLLTRLPNDGTPFIDEYIRDNVKLSAISDFHMTYDPVLRAIYIFVVRTGQTEVDTALVYFIDKGPADGWCIKGNWDSDSGYSASCSALVKKAVGDDKIYTGGWDDGYIWELETTAKNDNDAAYKSGCEFPNNHFGDPQLTKRFDRAGFIVETKGNYDLYVNVSVDGAFRVQLRVSLKGVGGVYGTGVYGTAVYGETGLIEVVMPIHIIGKRIKYHIFNNNADEDFFISHIYTDFKPLGRQVD